MSKEKEEAQAHTPRELFFLERFTMQVEEHKGNQYLLGHLLKTVGHIYSGTRFKHAQRTSAMSIVEQGPFKGAAVGYVPEKDQTIH